MRLFRGGTQISCVRLSSFQTIFDSISSTVCRNKDLIVLSDEIYARCFTNGGSNLSIAKFYPEGTLVCSGIAKWCGGGGWRVGYVMFPKELRPLYDAVIREGGQTYATVAEPIQVCIDRLKNFNTVFSAL